MTTRSAGSPSSSSTPRWTSWARLKHVRRRRDNFCETPYLCESSQARTLIMALTKRMYLVGSGSARFYTAAMTRKCRRSRSISLGAFCRVVRLARTRMLQRRRTNIEPDLQSSFRSLASVTRRRSTARRTTASKQPNGRNSPPSSSRRSAKRPSNGKLAATSYRTARPLSLTSR